jgi:uncharacterized protein YbbK (DUF523 family)
MKAPLFISACLAGLITRYDGKTRSHPRLADLADQWVLVPICPEILGGLGIPRPQCRFRGGDGVAVLEGVAQVMSITGEDCTDAFLRGAREVKKLAELVRPDYALLKDNSPSCGVHNVDVEGTKQPGRGITAAVLGNMGIRLLTEQDPLPESHSPSAP